MISNSMVTRRQCLRMLGALTCGVGLPLTVGCRGSDEKAYEELRRRVLLNELPADVLSLADAYAGFVERGNLTVVGRIFASTGSPFVLGRAAFNLIELPKPGHNHEDPGDCPFCKREMENAATAVVQILDSNGVLLRQSAERLLGLRSNQDVVVRGSVSMVVDTLVVNAHSLHVLTAANSSALEKRIHG